MIYTMYRLATIFAVISTAYSKFTVTRGEIDSVRITDLPGSPWEYKCARKSINLCECYYSYKTIFSMDNEILRCRIDELCKKNTIVLSAVSIPVKGARPTIKSIEFWNVKNTGVWEDKTDIVTKKYVKISKNNLIFKDSVKSDWKGQFFKVAFTNPNISCITIKVAGQIEYPFNFDKIFPPSRQKTTVTTTIFKTLSDTTKRTQKTTTAPITTTNKSTTSTTEPITTTILPTTTTKSQPTISQPTISQSKSTTTTKALSTTTTATKSQPTALVPSQSKTTKTISSIPPSKQGKTDNGGDNLPIYVALAVVSVVVVVLLVVVFLLCRRRSATEKGKEANRIELSSNNAKFDNPNYLQALKSSHIIEDQSKYSYAGSATFQQRPKGTGPLPVRGISTLPPKPDEFYETVNDSYLQPVDTWHLPGNKDERLRQLSVLSANSQSGLLGTSSPQESENLYADLTPIQENYEPVRTQQHDNNPTYQGIQGESAHYDDLANVNAVDVYAPLQENIFTNGQENYAVLNTKPSSVDNISNAAYEKDNVYHVLEK